MLLAHSPSQLQSLAAKWRAIGMALVALAREITLAHKQRAHSGIAKAEYLEAALFAALVSLSGEIVVQSRDTGKRSAADEEAHRYLETVHALLSVMVLLIQQLRRDLACIAERWAALIGVLVSPKLTLVSAPVYTPGFLDSG